MDGNNVSLVSPRANDKFHHMLAVPGDKTIASANLTLS